MYNMFFKRSVMPSVPPPIENNDSHDNSDLLM